MKTENIEFRLHEFLPLTRAIQGQEFYLCVYQSFGEGHTLHADYVPLNPAYSNLVFNYRYEADLHPLTVDQQRLFADTVNQSCDWFDTYQYAPTLDELVVRLALNDNKPLPRVRLS